ncbi:MAG TPA: hypothetical protein VM370_04750 [Candidatus Thermoplasmatota archaeon]|nr:hypothetical protein [Candidatus Thermoplasmatota archaeon]
MLTATERRLIRRLRTPAQVQAWLRDEVAYNHAKKSMRSFRGVLAHKAAHCLEGALAAAFLLEHHGFPPLLLDLESTDQLDHVVFCYQRGGKWGAVGKSRYPALMGRKPVYASVRALAQSYLDPFVDTTGRVTGWALYDLRSEQGKPDWRWDRRHVWRIERALLELPHAPLSASDARHKAMRARYIAWKQDHPREEPPTSFYRHGARMM